MANRRDAALKALANGKLSSPEVARRMRVDNHTALMTLRSAESVRLVRRRGHARTDEGRRVVVWELRQARRAPRARAEVHPRTRALLDALKKHGPMQTAQIAALNSESVKLVSAGLSYAFKAGGRVEKHRIAGVLGWLWSLPRDRRLAGVRKALEAQAAQAKRERLAQQQRPARARCVYSPRLDTVREALRTHGPMLPARLVEVTRSPSELLYAALYAAKATGALEARCVPGVRGRLWSLPGDARVEAVEQQLQQAATAAAQARAAPKPGSAPREPKVPKPKAIAVKSAALSQVVATMKPAGATAGSRHAGPAQTIAEFVAAGGHIERIESRYVPPPEGHAIPAFPGTR